MNKQTNIYRNYIFYHLADGRILASMPKGFTRMSESYDFSIWRKK